MHGASVGTLHRGSLQHALDEIINAVLRSLSTALHHCSKVSELIHHETLEPLT